LFPDKKITVLFQPHLYSRTRDFAEGFSESLSLADEALLLDIYPAREEPIEGVNSEMLLSNITADRKLILAKEEVGNYASNNRFEVFITLGAGDIDRLVTPLKEIFNKTYAV
jgi:UDP-N-acetylmuramate--alanine ligase